MLLFGTQGTMEQEKRKRAIFKSLNDCYPTLLCHDLWACGLNGCQLLLMAAGGCLLTAAYCVKMLSLPVSLVTEVYFYFYLTDTWKVITTTTWGHCSV